MSSRHAKDTSWQFVKLFIKFPFMVPIEVPIHKDFSAPPNYNPGYYHLRGRADLALPVQRRILPQFGFEGSRADVLDMVSHCSQFIADPEAGFLLRDLRFKLP